MSELPADAERGAEILDRYILGTRLRLRRVDTGQDVVFKLTQKVRAVDADPEVVKTTNTYLSAEEYEVMAALPAAPLRKTRWRVTWNDRDVAVDELHDRHQGLLLAEIELDPEETPLPLPPFAARDVTGDGRFAGGALATAPDEEIGDLRRPAALTEGT